MSFPILDLLDKYGIDSLDDPECENRIFCEMSRLGGQPSGNIIQKAFWHLAHEYIFFVSLLYVVSLLPSALFPAGHKPFRAVRKKIVLM
jgi:hypothetical protein